MGRLTKLEKRVKTLEKKVAELVEKVQPKQKFISEDSDGFRDFPQSKSIVPPITNL